MDLLIRSKTMLTFVVVAVAAAAGAGIAMTSQSLPANAVSTVALMGFVVIVVCAWPIGRRVAAGNFDLLEPVVLGCTMLAVICGLRPIITVITGDYVLVDRFDARPFFSQAVLIGLIGTVTFVAAYEFTSLVHRGRRSSDRPSLALNFNTVLQYGFAISGLALVLYSLYVHRAGGIGRLFGQRSVALAAELGNTSEYLSAAPVAIACFAILIVLARRGALSRGDKLLAIACSFLPALLFGALGNRRFIVPCVMLPLLTGYLISGRRPKTSRVLVLVPVVFLVLATIPFARTEGARKQAGGLAPIYKQAFEQPAKTVSRFANGPDTDMLLYLSLQMNYQQSRHLFYNGRATAGDFLLAPIPSAVFQKKPTTARNDLLERLFGAPCTNVGGGLCPDFSILGTFYQDFWLIGVILGMALLGVFSALIWKRFESSPDSPYLALLAAVTTIYLPIVIRAGLMPATVWSLYFVLPTSLGIRLSRRIPRAARQQPAAAVNAPDPAAAGSLRTT
jgi:hypothetical protein